MCNRGNLVKITADDNIRNVWNVLNGCYGEDNSTCPRRKWDNFLESFTKGFCSLAAVFFCQLQVNGENECKVHNNISYFSNAAQMPVNRGSFFQMLFDEENISQFLVLFMRVDYFGYFGLNIFWYIWFGYLSLAYPDTWWRWAQEFPRLFMLVADLGNGAESKKTYFSQFRPIHIGAFESV